MEQYISKAALVAEIDRRKEKYITERLKAETINGKNILGARIAMLEEVLVLINTLEVKEVDLEKHLKEDIEDVLFDLNGVAVKGATHCLTVEDVKDIAKHFYELGMAASYKAQKGEEV